MVMTDLQKFSDKHGAFYSNPFTPIKLLRSHRIGAGERSCEAPGIAFHSDVHKRTLRVGDTIEFQEAGTWKVELTIACGKDSGVETLFFHWIPGHDPTFLGDPRTD